MELGKVKYGLDKELEEEANRLLRQDISENTRSVSRDVEKMRFEAGLISSEELQYYDPDNDWDTQDSAFAILVNPPPGQQSDLDWVEAVADVDDGNVRARNDRAVERKKLRHIVNDGDNWGSTAEEIPLLGINEGPRKVCTKCKQSKGLTLFSPDNRNKDGLRSWCKECRNASERIAYARKNAE